METVLGLVLAYVGFIIARAQELFDWLSHNPLGWLIVILMLGLWMNERHMNRRFDEIERQLNEIRNE